MKNRIARLTLIAATTACLAAPAFAASPFKLDIHPIFQGKMSEATVTPLRIEIQNTGADADGMLTVTSGTGSTSYPIQLPRGADKSLIVYPTPIYNGVHLELATNQGNFETDSRETTSNYEGQRVLLITSDGPGELGFLQPVSTGSAAADAQPQSQLWDVYSKPGESPGRPVGYQGIDAIILGPGAERLTDDEVEAIKEWTLTGHTLMFVGGASAPILFDRRWEGVLPAHGFHTAELTQSEALKELGGTDAPSTTITSGSPNEGARAKSDGGLLVYAEQPLGLGRVIYVSFNPFDSPINKWEGKRAAITHLLGVTQNLLADAFIRSYSANEHGGQGDPYVLAGPSPITTLGVPGSRPSDSDPFNTKLPETGKIFYVLAAYFLAVIPLNFLLLKKFKRGELAWVTAPVLSFGFAAILFMSAAGLYSAKMSTVSNGLVLAQDGGGNGIFMGTTQMFVPRAGSYDLKLSGVDSISGNRQVEDGAQNADLEPVDRGEITIPDMSANNLTFKKLSYHQVLPTEKWFHFRLVPDGGTRVRCEMSNTGPYALNDASLSFGALNHAIGKFSPGDTKTMTVDLKDITAVHDLTESDVRTFTDRSPRAALTGTLSGFRPGPQLGEDLTGRSSVNFVMFSSWQGANP